MGVVSSSSWRKFRAEHDRQFLKRHQLERPRVEQRSSLFHISADVVPCVSAWLKDSDR